jgi:hypothetical protein
LQVLDFAQREIKAAEAMSEYSPQNFLTRESKLSDVMRVLINSTGNEPIPVVDTELNPLFFGTLMRSVLVEQLEQAFEDQQLHSLLLHQKWMRGKAPRSRFSQSSLSIKGATISWAGRGKTDRVGGGGRRLKDIFGAALGGTPSSARKASSPTARRRPGSSPSTKPAVQWRTPTVDSVADGDPVGTSSMKPTSSVRRGPSHLRATSTPVTFNLEPSASKKSVAAKAAGESDDEQKTPASGDFSRARSFTDMNLGPSMPDIEPDEAEKRLAAIKATPLGLFPDKAAAASTSGGGGVGSARKKRSLVSPSKFGHLVKHMIDHNLIAKKAEEEESYEIVVEDITQYIQPAPFTVQKVRAPRAALRSFAPRASHPSPFPCCRTPLTLSMPLIQDAYMTDVHVIFTMLRCTLVYVTEYGVLKGYISRNDLIEAGRGTKARKVASRPSVTKISTNPATVPIS